MGRPRSTNPVVNKAFYVRGNDDLRNALALFADIGHMTKNDFIRISLWRGMSDYYNDVAQKVYFLRKLLESSLPPSEKDRVESQILKLENNLSEMEKYKHYFESYSL